MELAMGLPGRLVTLARGVVLFVVASVAAGDAIAGPFACDNVMMGGFIIQGEEPQTVVVRARGPSLGSFGITNPLADPVLQLYSGQTVIAANDDWQLSPDAATIQSSGFAPNNPKESAIRITLNPGAYTAIVTGKNGTTGVGIIEVFAQ